MKVVATLTSAALSRWQSSIVRTEWPDFQPDVPEEREEALDAVLAAGHFALRQQDQHVDVGAGVQLAAPVAADRDQVDVSLARADVQCPGAAQDDVDHARAVADQRSTGSSSAKRCLRLASPSASALRNAATRSRVGLQRRGQRVEERPRRGCAPEPGLASRSSQRCGGHVHAGGCSCRAERQYFEAVVGHEHGVFPLRRQRVVLVTTVQPSGSSLTWRRPALTIGSMVKVMPASQLEARAAVP